MNITIAIIGIAAGVLTSTSMMPQVVKTIKTKKADHISAWMIVILIAGVSLWIVYGIMKKDLPIMFTNTFSLIINLIMLLMRYKFSKTKTG